MKSSFNPFTGAFEVKSSLFPEPNDANSPFTLFFVTKLAILIRNYFSDFLTRFFLSKCSELIPVTVRIEGNGVNVETFEIKTVKFFGSLKKIIFI